MGSGQEKKKIRRKTSAEDAFLKKISEVAKREI
jgi:hypothetical protein